MKGFKRPSYMKHVQGMEIDGWASAVLEAKSASCLCARSNGHGKIVWKARTDNNPEGTVALIG